ncbi:hypothetical protein CCGE531_28710 (plasmid) [Rhizobium sp. CCGE531]|nr:hypothetical protein CCGE531_28710 [Rhizobium sp. CCGE531]AYG76417.1 hypothetical protein CCGE532_28185 [Rhizobium sp. CCGE532]
MPVTLGSSAPIFTRDRAEAAEFAIAHGGSLGYIDVLPADMHRIAPARSQSSSIAVSASGNCAANRFVVPRELADTVRPLLRAEAEAVKVLEFRQRSEAAARLVEQTDRDGDRDQASRGVLRDDRPQGNRPEISASLAEQHLAELVDQFTKGENSLANHQRDEDLVR